MGFSVDFLSSFLPEAASQTGKEAVGKLPDREAAVSRCEAHLNQVPGSFQDLLPADLGADLWTVVLAQVSPGVHA